MSKTNCSPYIYFTTNSRKLLSTLWNARKWHFQGVKRRFQKLFIPKFRFYQYLCTHSILVKKFSIIVIHMSSTQKCKYIGTLKDYCMAPVPYATSEDYHSFSKTTHNIRYNSGVTAYLTVRGAPQAMGPTNPWRNFLPFLIWNT